ncbi:MAG TPA: hypothetical protein VGB55_06355, partial [Tepidisphaeraceae bacterium]
MNEPSSPPVAPLPATPDSPSAAIPARRSLPFPLIWLRTRRRRLTIAAALCLVIYVSVLFTLTHLPKVPGALEQTDDKALHFAAY